MLDSLFRGVFDTQLTSVIAPADFLLCVGVSLLIGLMLSAMTMWHTRSSGSFAVTLALLPAVVCVVIMMVNGNVGAGVAVSGAFGLVRFRSAPGSAREIGDVFIAMGAGLIAGMGYLGYAALFSLLLGGVAMLYTALYLGEGRRNNCLAGKHRAACERQPGFFRSPQILHPGERCIGHGKLQGHQGGRRADGQRRDVCAGYRG